MGTVTSEDAIRELRAEVRSLGARLRATRLFGGGALVVVAILAAAPHLAPAPAPAPPAITPDVVEASEFALKGPDGKRWAVLGVDRDPPFSGTDRVLGPSLKFLHEGKERARVGLNGLGAGGLVLSDPSEQVRLAVAAASADTGLTVFDEGGNLRLEVGCNGKDSGSHVFLFDKDVHDCLSLSVDPDGKHHVEALDGRGQPVKVLPD